MKTLVSALITAGALVASTAGALAWTAPYPAPSPYPYPQPPRTPAFCEQYAIDYADATVGDRSQQALVGGLVGAGIGAFWGQVLYGAPGAGLFAGAGIGAGIGYSIDHQQWEAQFNYAYGLCIQGYPLSYPWAAY